jgi:DNA (cytosine-5)-methyltransferase 1
MKCKTKIKKSDFLAIDLFSGCGGLSLGLKQAGFKVIAAVDNDALAVETYKANLKGTTVWEVDIRKLSVTTVKKRLQIKRGQIDLLAGCPPCQGFSSVRTLNGALEIDDPRNDLLFEFQRFVEKLCPRVVMLENVPGLAADKRFVAFLKRMKALGYRGEHRILNAADYGVPQRRRRLIYLAGRGTKIDFALPSHQRRTVRDAISALPNAGKSDDPIHDMPENRSPRIMKMIKKIPKNGGSRCDLPEDMQLACHRRCDGFKDVYGRMAWEDVAPTITTGCFNPSKGRFLHPEENRAITMREATLLQGFPSRYKFPSACNKALVARMIGNALPPPFIAAHARAVYRKLLNLGD